MKDSGIDLAKVVIHAPYIVNLGNLENFDFSVNFLRGEVERASLLGIKNVVLHPGASVSYTREESIESIIKGLNLILDNDLDVTICLETMAGKGTEIGKNIDEIKTIIDGVKYKNKIGVCLDTCHLWDSGIDLTKFDDYIYDFDKLIGLSYIKVIHVNDSKNEISSHKDRHENIGFGQIGFANLLKIINHKELDNIPKILETPYVEKEYPPYRYEIAMIKEKKFDDQLIEKIKAKDI
jgi:deoxyribonuclease-4